MRDMLKEFIVKTILGRKADTNNCDSIIMGCLSCAYDDMNTVGRFYSEGRKKDTFLIEYKKVLEKNNYSFSRELIDTVQELFGDNDRIENKKGYATRYGLSQKLVNMTFKYLYVFKEYTGLDTDFSMCDCPIDSNVLDQLKWHKEVWSKMTQGNYIECQNNISSELVGDSKYKERITEIGNMAFDFYCW